jgi:four helix bundle protein
MGFKSLDEIITYEFANNFKDGAYERLSGSREALRDLKFKGELQDAASGVPANIAEGFGRKNPSEFAQFIRYALASLREAETRLQDGIDRGYFNEADCRMTFRWAQRCRAAGSGLHRSQMELAAKNREAKSKKRQPVVRQPRKRADANRRSLP